MPLQTGGSNQDLVLAMMAAIASPRHLAVASNRAEICPAWLFVQKGYFSFCLMNARILPI
jgi:hypothetical protein